MNNILTLDQMQNMSADDIINAYNNGYRLFDKTEKRAWYYEIIIIQ